MRLRLFHKSQLKTRFIQLDTRKCQACWKCLAVCRHQVIGKIEFLGHRHAVLKETEKCAGCLSCLKICPYGAYQAIESD
jgi:2-oxoglutarate ferredoxin oxidoreductase subunit delta